MLSGGAPESALTRLPAGAKLCALFAAATVVFLVEDWRHLAAALALIVLLYWVARLPLRAVWQEIRPALLVLALVAGVQMAVGDVMLALRIGLRFAAIILLAGLVNRTTPVSAMVAAIERALSPLAWFGVDPARAGLVLSLALRFIPVIAEEARAVREAQRARGLERSVFAVAVPLTIRVIKLADQVAEALDARGFGAPPGG